MIDVDCTELTTEEELALASQISDALGGRSVALVKGDRIVLDSIGGGGVDENEVEKEVLDFVRRRKDHENYSVEHVGTTLVVHSTDPVAGSTRKGRPGLPPNVFSCAFCGFVTQYQELYIVHSRSHGFGV